MKQLLWANLSLSNQLEAAAPAAVAGIGSAALGAATELERQAAALNDLAGRLRQPGSWLSPAATVFMRSAHAQAQGVLKVSGPLYALSQALTTLAAELGLAKAKAMAAVMRSRDLNHAGDALNATVSAQQSLLPPGSASPPGAEEDAAAITAAQNAAAQELIDAERRAIDAWARGAAAMDFVGNATDAAQHQWNAKNWDPSSHVSFTASTALTCGVIEELGLHSGGFVVGPDNRKYPLEIQTLRDRDGRLLVTSRRNAAKEQDWRVVDERSGVASIGEKAAGWQKVAVLLGAAAGASYPEASTFKSAMLGDLALPKGGGAYLLHGGLEPGASMKEASAEPPRGKGSALLNPPQRGLAAGKSSSAPDAVGLLDGVLAGVDMSRHLDDARAVAYDVVFEENSTGGLRSFIQAYRVTGLPGQAHGIDREAAYVEPDGKLALTPVTGEDPDLLPEWSPGPG